jgi:CcmD family protein
MTYVIRSPRWTTAFLVCLLVIASPAGAWAQSGAPLGSQTLGPAYWNVFVAYAIAWLLVLGWLIAMFRRLGRVEERLGNQGAPPSR